MEIDYSFLEQFKSRLISMKIKIFNNLIDYYSKNFLPELSQTTGNNQYYYESRYRDELKEFQYNVKCGVELEYLKFTKDELFNYTRSIAIEDYSLAKDFQHNFYIVVKSLRTCVSIVNFLKKSIPELEIYSSRWLCLRTEIQCTIK